MSYYTYILFNQRNGTLYIGVTNHLVKRVYEHKQHIFKGFTDKYDIYKLAYYEIHDDINEAIKREKQLKAWKRSWKLELIESHNPDWKDLYDEIS